jgi:hypothetical protein
MRKRRIAGATLVAAFTLIGALTSVATAAEPNGGPTACFRVSRFTERRQAGNWRQAGCTTELEKLTGEWVRSLAVDFITENLWCALIVPYTAGTRSETGSWSNERCSTAASNGRYIEIVWAFPPVFLDRNSGMRVNLNDIAKEEVGSELQSTVGTIKSHKLTVEVSVLETESGNSDTYLAKLFGSEKAGTETCETAGAAEKGEIEEGQGSESDSAELVTTSTAPLTVGVVYTIKSLTIICGMVEVSVKGSELGSIEPINTEIEAGSNRITAGLTCSKTLGVPSKTKYKNNKGEEKTAELTVTAGGVRSKGCELIGTSETSTIKLLPNVAIELVG